MAVNQGRVLNVEQAAALLQVSRRWLIREGVRRGRVPYLRPPGSNQIRFLESDLWAVLKAWRVDGEIGTQPKDRQKPKAKKRRG